MIRIGNQSAGDLSLLTKPKDAALFSTYPGVIIPRKSDRLSNRKQEGVFKRRVKNRVREMQIDAAAKAELDGSAKILTETSKTRTSSKTPSKESVYTSGLLQIDPKDAWKCYVRPNKPFSKFSEQEKREYWRAQNGKRRAQGKIA